MIKRKWNAIPGPVSNSVEQIHEVGDSNRHGQIVIMNCQYDKIDGLVKT